MNNFFLIGVVVLIVLIILLVGAYVVIWMTQPEYVDSGQASIVTHSKLGHRGEMGNQMFQIATLVSAGKRSQAQVVLPPKINDEPIMGLFDLSQYPQGKLEIDARFYEYDNYQHIDIPRNGKVYDIAGYRQAYHYFLDNEDGVRKLFTPREEVMQVVQQQLPSHYIAVHMRRGDYMKPMHYIPLLREFRRCQLAYYREGVRRLRLRYPTYPILVCTDSPDWVKTILPEIHPEAQLANIPEGIKPMYSDFCTLYQAHALVISNSTYSWWAAYLKPSRAVIAPSPWWDPSGFVGKAIALDGPYLHYPEWALLNPDDGSLVRVPFDEKNNRPDYDHVTPAIYKMVRGMMI